MSEKLTIGLPVMLHKESEIQAFLVAKERIEKYGISVGQPFDVGAFLYYFPRALSKENREQQIKNQKSYCLPIVHAQAPIQCEHSLAYGPEEEKIFGEKGLLETTIEQCAALREYDPVKKPCDIDIHAGVSVVPRLSSEGLLPCQFTLDAFLERKEILVKQCALRFEGINTLANRHGLGAALENTVTAALGPSIITHYLPEIVYLPLNDLETLTAISRGRISLDIGHWAATRSSQALFEKNQADAEKAFLFKMEGIDSWDEYFRQNPDFSEYFPYTRAMHISNVTGLGVFLHEFPEIKKKWGGSGTVEGLLSREELRVCLDFARTKRIPVALEVDYDVKNIPLNQYREADAMLAYILE